MGKQAAKTKGAFAKKQSQQNHTHKHKLTVKAFFCTKCNEKKYFERDSYIRHFKGCTGLKGPLQTIYSCPTCNRQFSSNFNLKRHQESHRKKQKMLQIAQQQKIRQFQQKEQMMHQQYMMESIVQVNSSDSSLVKMQPSQKQQQIDDWAQKIVNKRIITFIKYRPLAVKGVLGKGTYGHVFDCFDPNQPTWEYAVKVSNDIERHKLEVLVYKILSRKDCAVEKYYDQISNGLGIIILEKFGQPLSSFQKELQHSSDSIKIKLSMIVLEKIAMLNENGIIHGDLKSNNILIDDLINMNVKVIDFGLSVVKVKSLKVPTNKKNSMMCIKTHQSPESFFGYGNCSFGVDTWALGCTLIRLFYGRHLFPTNNRQQTGFHYERYIGKLPVYLQKRSTKHKNVFQNPIKKAFKIPPINFSLHQWKIWSKFFMYDQNKRPTCPKLFQTLRLGIQEQLQQEKTQISQQQPHQI